MKHLCVALLGAALLCLLMAGAQADLQTLSLSVAENQMTLEQQELETLQYRVQVGELTAMDVMTTEGAFSRLMIPGFHASQIEGTPELPMMNRLIEIPYGATVRVEVVSSESRLVNLADYGITHPIFPVQPSMPKNADPATWPFVINRDAYNVERVSRELVAVVPQGRLRSVNIGRLEVSPVEYYPAENQIRVYETIAFRIHFDNADFEAGNELKAETSSPFFQVLYNMIEGTRDAHDDHPNLMDSYATMVIVTPPEFENQMQEFVDWKTECGYNVIVAVTGTPEVGSTKEEIQTYIHTLYWMGTEEQPAPTFVLFVGDVEQMPTWTLSGDATDRPYCDVEGDLVPDIYYGRFSATNPTQLQAILDKTLMYEQFTMSNPSYLGEVVMIAGMDSGYGATHGNGQINYGTNEYFNAAHGIFSHTYLYPNSGSNAANIVQNVSDGVSFINYTAHGSTTSWSDPSFTQSNINGLQNSEEYCTAIGNCCLTSSYNIGECFAETWLRAPDKGAIGYIGASNSTYWDEDFWFGVGHTTNITANPTYAETGLGAYDGLFHDHGEAMTQWYVCNDAIVYAGNLAVLQSGSSRITYYWNIYNLMGDPSLSTYLGVPAENPVVYPPTIFTTWTSITIEAAPGSYVGLSRDGELLGAGMVGATGTLELPIFATPLLPGPAKLVVTAQNHEPYITDVSVIVPATIYIDPTWINANVETEISVGVFEYDGVTPKPGIEVWADGLNYESDHSFSDATGYCTITVNYPYGPKIDIVGQNPAEPWELFREYVSVVASSVLGGLSVTTEVGLSNQFALNLPGVLHASCPVPDYTLWAFLNGELVGSTTDSEMEITPDETGSIEGIIAISGYNLIKRTFPVIEAFGTLAGHVDADGPAVGAIVRGYDDEDDLIFTAVANASGDYNVGSDILVAPYTITADYFGYLHYETPFFVNYGANSLDIDMTAAPSGVMTGTVTQSLSGLPLEATVKIYRSDTMELYAETTSDPLDGSYTTSSLPYFDYSVNVKAWHHIPQTISMTIDQSVHNMDFVLDPTIGDLLLIDDSAKSGIHPAKIDEKTGAVIAEEYTTETAKTAADMIADLEDLGYTVTSESISVTDPQMWGNYDLLMVCTGANTGSLPDAAFRNSLINFVENGGHLLIEGGEVGYTYRSDTNFGAKVLHITGWNSDSGGNVTVAEPDHYVMSVPNVITGPITVASSTYADQDAMDATTDAVVVGSWTSYPTDASIITYDSNPAPEGGQIVFFCFNYSAMDASVRPLLLQNTVTWLMTPEFGDCTVEGTVTLLDETDHSGVLVEVIPGGASTTTNAAGEYVLEGLFNGNCSIKASKDGWSIGMEDISLSSGQHMTGVDFLLTPVFASESCESPGLSIPDSNPTGVYDDMTISIGGMVTAVEVYVNITHTYIGDLIVDLTSPDGTNVVLHNRSGGTAENIIGWYPTDLTPAESLDAFIGDDTDGNWRLHVSDNAGADLGVLNEWCLKIFYGGGSADVPVSGAPKSLALFSNTPNPLKMQTMIRFDLPKAGAVDLSIFDVTGRRVATLVSGAREAGTHQAVWTGRDQAGHPVASGVYFYRLAVDNRELTKKMLLMK
ncbi:MAG: proprotein convertase P-domain-containing protein [Candidatus Eisenbacteria bacterium]|uniref:Proprotein convertase P-domain-containing protein n=1 Tax=Eiseniibacteriota bacterium TaxID=2212470 RepID=A0A948W5X9_UNCEI|nr:proprotein convertase P-domain-containing protein [Candidatus Eisenbacteria bacterium]MBU2690924.1 proprotein convertase P-domain-containing protein [Candidatus Eisenbacteria bacterium]